ncbi:MAG: aspartate 1-decarboxylase [Candidatus Marinimicrobia bacterium]|nr:aspartate 1-decarboxylase [Candidatus Neomarinimicrobiota bacterium]MDD5581604.1 aspartate 1-decarboxylase [Candidatus Neomarinimicrobiota bacterium]
MKRTFLKSKIHRAVITDANLNYSGSLALDEELMKAADILEYEWVQVVNINNGQRFETYVIKGEAGKKGVCLNGAAARLGVVGDRIIIMSYCQLDEEEIPAHRPKIIITDDTNTIIKE